MAAIDKIYLSSFKTFTEFKKWCEAQPPIKDKYGKEDRISHYINYDWYDPKYWKKDDCHPVMNAPYYVDAYIIRNCPIEEVQEELMVNYGHYSQKRICDMYDVVKNWNRENGECPYWTKLEDFILNEDGTITLTSIDEKSAYEEIKDGELFTSPACDKYPRGKHFRISKIPVSYECRVCNYPIAVRGRDNVKRTPTWQIEIKLPDYVDEPFMDWSSHSDAKHAVGTWDFCSEHVLSHDGWSSSHAACKSIRSLTRRITKWNLPVGTIVQVQGRYVGEDYEIIVKK